VISVLIHLYIRHHRALASSDIDGDATARGLDGFGWDGDSYGYGYIDDEAATPIHASYFFSLLSPIFFTQA
jgi:hypothetical protein